MEILLKIKPNEKYENLKFCENLKIWLEILLKIKPNEKYENLNFAKTSKFAWKSFKKISNFGSKLPPEIGYFWNLF